MAEMYVAVSYTVCHQTGQDSFKDCRVTRIFEGKATLSEIVEWAKQPIEFLDFSNTLGKGEA